MPKQKSPGAAETDAVAPLAGPILTEAEIVEREAEKAELLARLHAAARREQGMAPSPAYSEPETIVEVDEGALLDRVEEVLAADPAAPVGSIQARIDHLTREHQAAMERADAEFDAALTALLKERRAAELEAARQVDTDVAARLTAATETATTATTVPAADTITAADVFRAELVARLAPEREQATAARRELATFARAYRPTLERLQAVTEAEWLRGLPMADQAAVHSLGAVRQLRGQIEMALSTLASTEQTIDRCEQELTAVVDSVAHRGPFPWEPTTRDERAQWLNGVLRDLRTQTDGSPLAFLNQLVKGITDAVEGVNATKAKYAGTPEAAAPVEYENRPLVVEEMKETARLSREPLHEGGRQTRAIVGSPFDVA